MSFYLRQLEKEKQIKSNISRRKEITKIWSEISEIKNKSIEKINKTKSWFFEVRVINKPLAKITKKGKKTQITNIRDERGDITIDSMEIKKDKEGILWITMPINLKTKMNWINSLKDTYFQTHLGRNRQSE